MNIQVLSILLSTLITMVFFQNCDSANEFSSEETSSKVTSLVSEPVSEEPAGNVNETEMISYVHAKKCKRLKRNEMAPNVLIHALINDDDMVSPNIKMLNMDMVKISSRGFYSVTHVKEVGLFLMSSGSNDDVLKRDLASVKNDLNDAIGDICDVNMVSYYIEDKDGLDLTTKISEKDLMELQELGDIRVVN